MKIVACNSNRPLAEAVANELNLPLTKASVRRFGTWRCSWKSTRMCAARMCS